MSEAPATEPELETPAARIIGELLEQGEAVDEGGFTLDAAAAVAKLDAFAYVDRSVYLLPMVEGLIGLGARAIVIETEGEDLRVGGLGLQLDAERWFAELYSCAIGTPTEGSGRAFARLAIGLDMLLGSGTVKSVRMSYSRPSHAIIGEYRHREPPQISRGQPGVVGELSIFVDHPWLGSEQRKAALTHLREAVRFSAHEITLDGALISQQAREWFETLRGEGPGYRYSAGLEQRGSTESVIELWHSGVCMETVAGQGVGFRAAIELDAPRRDLSQMKFVRDAALGQALAAVEQAYVEARQQLEQADASWTRGEVARPREWSRARVDRVLDRSPEPPRPPALPVRGKEPALLPLDRNELLRLYSYGWLPAIAGIGIMLFTSYAWLKIRSEGFPQPPLLYAFGGFGLVLLAVQWLENRRMEHVIEVRERGIRGRAEVTGHVDANVKDQTLVRWKYVDHEGVDRVGHSRPRPADEALSWKVGEEIMIYFSPERPDRSWWEAKTGPRENLRFKR